MVDEPVDSRGGGHGILKNAIPLTEDQITTDQHAFAFIAFGQERKEDLHLGAALLEITDIIEDDGGKAIELMEFLFQAQGLLGGQQADFGGGDSKRFMDVVYKFTWIYLCQ